MSVERNAKRSPIKERPLRSPGQGLDERIQELAYGRIMAWGMGGFMTLIWAGQEWLRWAMKSPPMPWVATIVAVGFCALAVWRIWRTLPEVRRVILGLRGEKYVGQWLEKELRPRGYQVFHDIVGDGFNIDHVLVGPEGVFAIETKTFSKPERGQCEIEYDGESMKINGRTPDRDMIGQAKAGAGNVAKILEDMTGRKVSVKPVVLCPNWYVREPKNPAVWVLNEKRVLGYIKNRKPRISPEDVSLFADRIATYVRGRDRMSQA